MHFECLKKWQTILKAKFKISFIVIFTIYIERPQFGLIETGENRWINAVIHRVVEQVKMRQVWHLSKNWLNFVDLVETGLEKANLVPPFHGNISLTRKITFEIGRLFMP